MSRKHSPKNELRHILILIPLLIAILIISGWYVIQNPQTHTIIKTKNGFNPERITINVGDTVRFKSQIANEEHWPASNLHPEHTIYPEFDPKKPLGPDEEWSFTFTRPGSWRFHDHLHPNFGGVIIVRGENNDKIAFSDNCKGISGQEKIQCWDEEFRAILEGGGGVEGAFDLVSDLYANDSDFPGACHGLTHTIGKKAYQLYVSNVDFEPSLNAAYCGYGFYHGFMEALIAESNDVKKAQEFCDFVHEKLGGRTAIPKGACFHGIGHGFVEDEPDPSLHGDSQKIIEFPLTLCERVGRNEDEKYRCDSGIYNGLAILYNSKKYDLIPDQNDPFADCHNAPSTHAKKGCYEEMNTLVPQVLGFEKGLLAAQEVPKPYDHDAIYGLASYYTYAQPTQSNEDMIGYCRTLREENQLNCITALVGGLIEGGKPEDEDKRVVELCKSNQLHQQEKEACYNFVHWNATQIYDPSKVQGICETFEQEFTFICQR